MDFYANLNVSSSKQNIEYTTDSMMNFNVTVHVSDPEYGGKVQKETSVAPPEKKTWGRAKMTSHLMTSYYQ